MPCRLLAFPIAAGMLVSVVATPVADRLHLPFAAIAFSAVVSLMPGFFLFNAATGLVELVSIGPKAPAALLTSIVTSGVTAFLIIMAMTFGLILPRMLFERVLPSV
jgi:Threonine/Serine exporter, ThrE